MESFKLIGLRLNGKTKNENGQSGKDCGKLWQHFEENKVIEQIPNKIADEVYAVYYDYESDENGLFSYFIGCKVDDNAEKPENLDELLIPEQHYHKETAKGRMTDCITDAWKNIWSSGINRKFGFDFEVYGERSRNWDNAAVDIFLSVNE